MTDPEAIAPSQSVAPAPRRLARFARGPHLRVGPGLITGVADDDPSGIATYSQAGAQFGLNMLWTMPLCYPFMAAIQLVCARIGRVTGRGIAANMKAVFPVPVVAVVVGLLLIANTLNIAADVAAMGEVAELVTGAPRHVMTVVFVILMAGLLIAIPYHRYVKILKWLTLSLLAYAAVLFAVHVPWGEVLVRTFLPRLTFDAQAAAMIVAIFGTTISPYLFFWQASEEVEDMQHVAGARPLLDEPAAAPAELRRIAWDTWSGMFYSNVTAWFIILACGVTLHASGVTDIQTAAEAADALRPLAGDMAFLLFALGILGVGLIGVPTLAGSAAYGLAEAMGWQWGLERSVNEARGFYGVIFISMALGIVIQFSPINPMKALFWSAVINGVVAVPLMIAILMIAARKSVMGQFAAGRSVLVLGWMATAIMAAASLWMFWSD